VFGLMRETTVIGIVGLILAVIVLLKRGSFFASAVLVFFSLLIIFFGKDENKIERRRDG